MRGFKKNKEVAHHQQTAATSPLAQLLKEDRTGIVYTMFRLLSSGCDVEEKGAIIITAFAEYFKDCCAAACHELWMKKGHKSKDFLEAKQEKDALYERIKEKLGEDKLLINKFDASKNEIAGISENYIYQQGFRDCVYMLRWMGIL